MLPIPCGHFMTTCEMMQSFPPLWRCLTTVSNLASCLIIIKLHSSPGESRNPRVYVVYHSGSHWHTTVERQREWQIINTCIFNDGSNEMVTTGQTNSKEGCKCAADTGTSEYASCWLLMIVLLKDLLIRHASYSVSSVTWVLQWCRYIKAEQCRPYTVTDNGIRPWMNQEPSPPPDIRTLQLQYLHFHNFDNQICLKGLSKKWLLLWSGAKRWWISIIQKGKSQSCFWMSNNNSSREKNTNKE